MQKRSMKRVMVATVVLAVGLVLVIWAVSTSNSEVRLRNTIRAKQRDNVSEYDNLLKKISQAAQVTDAQKAALLEIFRGHAEARGGGASGGIMSWLHESVPDVDTTTFNNLQNIIAASRDRFTMRQKELLRLKSDHDSMLDSFPSGPLLGTLGREKIDVTVVTSSRADETFATGRDDDFDLPVGGE